MSSSAPSCGPVADQCHVAQPWRSAGTNSSARPQKLTVHAQHQLHSLRRIPEWARWWLDQRVPNMTRSRLLAVTWSMRWTYLTISASPNRGHHMSVWVVRPNCGSPTPAPVGEAQRTGHRHLEVTLLIPCRPSPCPCCRRSTGKLVGSDSLTRWKSAELRRVAGGSCLRSV